MRAPTILVVEDDPIARNLIVHVLSAMGLRVYEADSATEAMIVCNSLKDRSLDLVITDHAVHQTTGRELASRILESCPDVKILHLSVMPYSRMQEENALSPGSTFLQKPFTGTQLASVVQNILAPRTQ